MNGKMKKMPLDKDAQRCQSDVEGREHFKKTIKPAKNALGCSGTAQ